MHRTHSRSKATFKVKIIAQASTEPRVETLPTMSVQLSDMLQASLIPSAREMGFLGPSQDLPICVQADDHLGGKTGAGSILQPVNEPVATAMSWLIGKYALYAKIGPPRQASQR